MNYRFSQFLVFCLLLSFLSCEKEEEEIQLSDQDVLENLVGDYEARTGIRIFYEPGNTELQEQLELDHSVDESDSFLNDKAEFLVDFLSDYSFDF
ncbi:MAG: hypothetical protein AAFN81_20730 [Bacteroidota bacterium]